ncbi:MAG: hypothetical protein R2764_07415 [Bacteroidales bacterium]
MWVFPITDYLLEVLKAHSERSDKAREAGKYIGGTTIEDTEPNLMAVTGFVHPDNLITNSKAQPW